MTMSSMTGLAAVAVIHRNSSRVPVTDLESLFPSPAVCMEALQRSPGRVLGKRCAQSTSLEVTSQALANGSSSHMLVNC